MKIGIVVNDTASELADYTTTHLAFEAHKRGHQISYISLADFSYGVDEQVHGIAAGVERQKFSSAEEFLKAIQSPDVVRKTISVDKLDVLLLRNDPSREFFHRPWARLAAINFGRLAIRHGVLVLNDPDGLTHAINKIYLQIFPSEIRPDAIITRNSTEIHDFIETHDGRAVIKPLQGSGGRNVFLVRKDQPENIKQMIASVIRDGYAIAQEYLPAITHGDTRLFMLNGRIFDHNGTVGALRRVRSEGDIRTNLTAGGKGVLAEITDNMYTIARKVGPQLIKDGIFLAGLDIVGDKVIEINVFSPGALVGAARLTGVNFMQPIIDSLESKIAYRKSYSGANPPSNAELAMW